MHISRHRKPRRLALLFLVTLLVLLNLEMMSSATSPAPHHAHILRVENLTPASAEGPMVIPMSIFAPQGSTTTFGVVINNSQSSASWILVRVIFSSLPSAPLTISTHHFLPFVTEISNNTVSAPFDITIGAPKNVPTGNYTLSGLVQLRTSLLPPYQTATLSFNYTVIVVPPAPESPSIQLAILDSIIISFDCITAVVLIEAFVVRVL